MGIKFTYSKEPLPPVENSPASEIVDQFKLTRKDRVIGLTLSIVFSAACIYGYEATKYSGWRWLFVFLGMLLLRCVVFFWKLKPYEKARHQESEEIE